MSTAEKIQLPAQKTMQNSPRAHLDSQHRFPATRNRLRKKQTNGHSTPIASCQSSLDRQAHGLRCGAVLPSITELTTHA